MDKMLRSILEQVKGVEGKFIEGIVDEFEAARKRKEKVQEKQRYHSRHLTDEQIEGLELPDMQAQQINKDAKNLFENIVMPLLVLTIRLEIDVVFHLSYNQFFNNIGPSGNKLPDEPKHV